MADVVDTDSMTVAQLRAEAERRRDPSPSKRGAELLEGSDEMRRHIESHLDDYLA